MHRMTMSHEPTESLGVFLRRWRGDRSIREVAAGAGLSVHSIWSKLEAGQPPSVETLFRVAEYTGQSVETLAAMAGIPIRRSHGDRDRNDRIDAMVSAVPRSAVLVDLLPELSPSEVDVLLTVAEGMIRGRK